MVPDRLVEMVILPGILLLNCSMTCFVFSMASRMLASDRLTTNSASPFRPSIRAYSVSLNVGLTDATSDDDDDISHCFHGDTKTSIGSSIIRHFN